MPISTVARALLGALLVVSGVVTPMGGVAAQGQGQESEISPDRIFLDSRTNELGTVNREGETYQIYRVENALPYASGIEVYQSGERVTDADRVRDVLRVVAWQRATRDIGPDDIEKLRSVRQQAEQIERIVTPPLEVLNTVLGVVEELKSISIGPYSAWDVVSDNIPQISRFVEVANELRNELQAWKSAAASTSSNAQEVITGLERIKAGKTVDYDKLSESFAATTTGINDLAEQSEQLQERIETTRDLSGTIAREGAEIRIVGDMLNNNFGRLADSLQTASNRIEQFQSSLEDQRRNLRSIRSTARTQHNQLMSNWRARQQAELRVFGSLGTPILFVLVGGLFLYSRRSNDGPAYERTGTARSDQEPRPTSPRTGGDRSVTRESTGSGDGVLDRPPADDPGPGSGGFDSRSSATDSEPDALHPKFCTECGSKIKREWKRCPMCGERI